LSSDWQLQVRKARLSIEQGEGIAGVIRLVRQPSIKRSCW